MPTSDLVLTEKVIDRVANLVWDGSDWVSERDKPVRPATATTSSVTAKATTTILLAANTSRVGAMFFNDSTSAAYLKHGATASTSSFTVKVFSNGYYELPSPVYTGRIDCIWDSANGAMRITELT